MLNGLSHLLSLSLLCFILWICCCFSCCLIFPVLLLNRQSATLNFTDRVFKRNKLSFSLSCLQFLLKHSFLCPTPHTTSPDFLPRLCTHVSYSDIKAVNHEYVALSPQTDEKESEKMFLCFFVT